MPGVLITGASSGIGAATARVMARDGWRVTMVGRDSDRLNTVMAALTGDGHRAVRCELTDDAARRELVSSVEGLDAVVHAAGRHAFSPPARPGRLRELLAANVEAAIALTAELLARKSIREPGGALIFMSSVAATVGSRMTSSYATSKAALLGYARALAADLAPRGIRVVSVVAGLVETPMGERLLSSLDELGAAELRRQHPLGLGSPDDIGELIAFLCSSRARWITGSEVLIDGGYSLR